MSNANSTNRESQRMEALKLATEKRQDMKALKEQIKSRMADPVDVLEHIDLAMSTKQFLMSIPAIGPTKASAIARRAGVPMEARLGGRAEAAFTPAYREALASELRGRGYGEAR